MPLICWSILWLPFAPIMPVRVCVYRRDYKPRDSEGGREGGRETAQYIPPTPCVVKRAAASSAGVRAYSFSDCPGREPERGPEREPERARAG
eukprot:COSAG03_NODE_4280_length_1609_cov_8.565563_1_plen_92_part_00